MNKNHPRYREISIDSSLNGKGSDQAKLSLGIVLHKDDKKFRSHAVKHLTNRKEFRNTWAKIKYIDKELILRSVAKLQEIECKHYSEGMKDPPCKNCQKYNLCTNFIFELENQYFNVVWQILREGSVIPRYAGYFSKQTNDVVFVLMPDRPIVIKAAILEDGSFNLMTCYSDADRNFLEMRDSQAGQVIVEARENSIIWFTDIKWGIGTVLPYENINQNKNRKKKKRGKKSQPFSRGGSRTWRQYLDYNNN